jgi:hypothetical protein
MQKVARIFAGLSQAQASILCAFVFLILFVQANLSLLLKLAPLAKDEKCKAENIKLVAMDFDREDLAGALFGFSILALIDLPNVQAGQGRNSTCPSIESSTKIHNNPNPIDCE